MHVRSFLGHVPGPLQGMRQVSSSPHRSRAVEQGRFAEQSASEGSLQPPGLFGSSLRQILPLHSASVSHLVRQ